MNCWHCKTELIWGSDHDVSDEYANYSMLTLLHCPHCSSEVEVLYPKEKMDEEDE